MSCPQVSVVMSVYNGAADLPRTLRSVLDQQGVALEFIVVDDGSADGSSQLLDAAAASDARLRVIHQPNAGLTRALIRGCEAASAPLVARQDAGDVSLPGRLLRQAELMSAHPRLSFVSCAAEYVDTAGHFLYRNVGREQAVHPIDVIDLNERYGMRDGPSHHGSVMFRRDAYLQAGGYRAEFYFGQDWDLWYRLAAIGKFCMLPETLYLAQVGIGDISTTRKPLQERIAALSLQGLHLRAAGQPDNEVLAQAALVRPTTVLPSDKRRSSAAAAYFLGECLRRNGNHSRASHYFRIAIRNQPWHLKTWMRLAQIALQRQRTSA